MKTDLKKEMRSLYAPPPDPVLVDVPPMRFLMADGTDEPGVAGYTDAISALYSLAYTLKFELKAEEHDFTVMPLEGLYATDDPEEFFREGPKHWHWTLMIRVPDDVTPEQVMRAKTEAAQKRSLPALGLVRLENLEEGTSAQVMHIGPYDVERPTIEKLHAFIGEMGMAPAGPHHEIYLSDPNRCAPEHLKTIVRQAVE